MRRLLAILTLGATACAMVQLAPAAATPTASNPGWPAGPGHTIVLDTNTGKVSSISSTTPLSDTLLKHYWSSPGSKTYTLDVYTGRVLSITMN